MSSLPRIFVAADNISDGKTIIFGSDAHHIVKVLRLSVGDSILVCDMQRTEYDGTIISAEKDSVTVGLGVGRVSGSEFPFEVVVFQGVPKGDKLETIVQKSVELGASAVIPVLCERSISRNDSNTFAKKLERLNKIASSAASQCGRGIVPAVLPQITYKEACKEIRKADLGFICYEGVGTVHIRTFLDTKTPKKVAFLIGPEGGLSSGDVALAAEMGIPLVGLGNRILRTETASGFVLSAISLLLDKY